MNLPIRFPKDEDVIADEVARFRALTPEERVRTLGEMVRMYHFLADHAARPEAVTRIATAEEVCGRAAIEEFVARHDRH